MRQLELYKVSIEYKDIITHDEWEKECEKMSRTFGKCDFPPTPPRKEIDFYSAVYPDFGGDPLKVAANNAIKSVVGDQGCWERYQVVVNKVECLGTVCIQE